MFKAGAKKPNCHSFVEQVSLAHTWACHLDDTLASCISLSIGGDSHAWPHARCEFPLIRHRGWARAYNIECSSAQCYQTLSLQMLLHHDHFLSWACKSAGLSSLPARDCKSDCAWCWQQSRAETVCSIGGQNSLVFSCVPSNIPGT